MVFIYIYIPTWMGHRCWWMVGTAIPICSCSWHFSRWNVASQHHAAKPQPLREHVHPSFGGMLLQPGSESQNPLFVHEYGNHSPIHPNSIQKNINMRYWKIMVPNIIKSWYPTNHGWYHDFIAQFINIGILKNYDSPIDLVAQFSNGLSSTSPKKSP